MKRLQPDASDTLQVLSAKAQLIARVLRVGWKQGWDVAFDA